MSNLLPIHGFVLAGGKSSRMGRDKALLPFCGVPLIEVALAKLRTFCSNASILGSRDDLQRYAPVVPDTRSDIGPGTAFEAALGATTFRWALLIPVDVPLVPAELLRCWAADVTGGKPCGSSFLTVASEAQPAFAMLHSDCAASVSRALDHGERRLARLLYAADEDDVLPVCPRNVTRFAPNASASQIRCWFSNVNSPEDLAEAEALAKAEG